MKRIISLILGLALAVSVIGVSSNVVKAKTLTWLAPKCYVCYYNSHGKVKLTKKKMTIKKFDVCPERDGWFVLQKGKASFKLARNCKFYNDVKRVSFRKIKKVLKKHPKYLCSFTINRNNKITEICYCIMNY